MADPADADVARLVEQAREAGREEALRLLTAEWRDAYLAAARRPVATGQEGSGWWVYGVLAAGAAQRLPGEAAGVEGAAVEQVEAGGLVALVSEVPLAEFGDEPLRAHLEDLGWVERVARAHEGVLEVAMAAGELVPMRLCTIYLERAGVAGFLAEHGEELRATLAALRGRSEWGVKVFAHEASPDAGEEPGEGSYLARRRRERDAREQARQRAEETARRVHERVAREAVGARVNPPQAPEAHGRRAQMLLNGAYLVEDAQRDALGAAVEELAAELAPDGLDVELTGPWPPYNFLSPATQTLP